MHRACLFKECRLRADPGNLEAFLKLVSVGCNAIVTQSPFVRVYTKKGRAFHQKFYDNSIKFHKTDRQTSLSKRFRHFQHFWRQTFCAISLSRFPTLMKPFWTRRSSTRCHLDSKNLEFIRA